VPRVLTARFMHETNTFSRVKTDMALIRRRDFHIENEIPQAFRGTRSALGATFEAADKYSWTLVHPVWPTRTRLASSPMTRSNKSPA
jgi:microcystin degradation protein MlrC